VRRLFECGVLLRLFIITVSGLYAYTGLTQPESLIYLVAHADRFTHLTMGGLAIFTVLGFVDLFVNDLLPDRFVIAHALRDRHLVNMAIAGCFAVQMWTCARYGLPRAILPFYAVYVVFVPVSAFADVHKRFKNKATTQ
jgi:hypothetical protein